MFAKRMLREIGRVYKLLSGLIIVVLLSACTMLYRREYQVKPALTATPAEIESSFRKYREFLIAKHIPNYPSENPNSVVIRIGGSEAVLPLIQRSSNDKVELSYSEDGGFRVVIVRIVNHPNADFSEEYLLHFTKTLERGISENTSVRVQLVNIPSSRP